MCLPDNECLVVSDCAACLHTSTSYTGFCEQLYYIYGLNTITAYICRKLPRMPGIRYELKKEKDSSLGGEESYIVQYQAFYRAVTAAYWPQSCT